MENGSDLQKNIRIVKCLYDNQIIGLIHPYISYYTDYKNNTLYIFSDAGRCIRPLLRTNDPSD